MPIDNQNGTPAEPSLTSETSQPLAGTPDEPLAGAPETHVVETQPSTPTSELIPITEYRKKADENARLRQRMRDAEAALKSFQEKERAAAEAELTRAQVLERRLAEREGMIALRDAQLQQIKTSAEVEKTAGRLGFRDPGDAMTFIERQIDYDTDGTPLNVEDLLTQLAVSKPYLLKAQQTAAPAAQTPAATAQAQRPAAPSVGASPANPARTVPAPALTHADLAGLPPAEVSRLFREGKLSHLTTRSGS